MVTRADGTNGVGWTEEKVSEHEAGIGPAELTKWCPLQPSCSWGRFSCVVLLLLVGVLFVCETKINR